MVTIKRLLFIVIIGGIAVLVVRRLFTTETSRIRNQLQALESTIAKKTDESNTQMLIKMERLQSLLANPVTISLPAYDISATLTPREVVQQIIPLRSRLSRLGLEFEDISIALADSDKAFVSMTVYAWTDRQTRNAVEAKCEMLKIDGKWRLADFSQVEVLQR